MAAKRKRALRTDEQKRAILAEIRGNVTVADVAKKHGVTASALYAWRNKLGTEPAKPTETNGQAERPKLAITGLSPFIEALIDERLAAIVQEKLPGAVLKVLSNTKTEGK